MNVRKIRFLHSLHRLGYSGAGEKGNEESIKSAADLKGKKVGVGLGTNYEEWLRANVQGVDIRTYDDDPTKYQDLRVGRIDAILVDRLAALDLVKKPTIRWPLRGCFLTSGSGCRIA
jgi:cystine transport system substrate-binding protein